MTLGSVKRTLIGVLVITRGSNLEHEVNIEEIIIKIIGDHHPISAMDIWYELGEDDQIEDGITYEEVNKILLQLERQKVIVRVEDEKWK